MALRNPVASGARRSARPFQPKLGEQAGEPLRSSVTSIASALRPAMGTSA